MQLHSRSVRSRILGMFLSALMLAGSASAQSDLGPPLSSMADFKAGKFQFASIKNQAWWSRVNEGPHMLAGADRVYVRRRWGAAAPNPSRP